MWKYKKKKPRGNQPKPPAADLREGRTAEALRNAELARVAAWTRLFI